MDATLYDSSVEPTSAGPASKTLSNPVARSVLSTALLLGVAADSLLRDSVPGIAFPMWIALVALAGVSLLWRADRAVSRETGAWLAGAVLFSLGLAWRNSEGLQFFDFVATIGCLGMAAIAASSPGAALFAKRLRDTVMAGVGVVARVAAGLIPLAFRELLVEGAAKDWTGRTLPVVRATIIAGALLIVFGSLLRGADPIFASLVSIPNVDFAELISHVVVIGFFTWVVAGWARASLIPRSETRTWDLLAPLQLNKLDVTTALGTLNVLFALFVLTQLGAFFGGERFLQARTGLTAAAYARQGFFQMVVVVALVVPVLVATRAFLRPGYALARRHTLLSLPIIGLLGAIGVSATLRLKMYVHFYGLTTDRLYALVFLAWLGFVLVWLSLTVLRDWGQPFVAGTLLSGLLTLAGLNALDPDSIVARMNVARASRLPASTQPTLDLAHLARLSGGAVPLAIRATLTEPSAQSSAESRLASDADRCNAASNLLSRWGPASQFAIRQDRNGAWRSWNADESAARSAVVKRQGELLAVQHATCERTRAAKAATGNSRI